MSQASAQATERWTGYVPLTTVLRCARHDSFAAGSDPSCRLRRSALLHQSLPCGGEYYLDMAPQRASEGDTRAALLLDIMWGQT